ncbi:MAG: efflux RND transporter periplasmic adaptor subunit [Pseudohongiellaceae bacterium]|nr:efflux RND transporter periplasmic adaptor subunit [Pseudohongiellaceae bacterium]
MKIWTKAIAAVLVIGLIALIAVLMQPAPVPVEVATITEGRFVVTVEDEGRTRARDPYIVASPISGRLLRSYLNEGDSVTQGQVVARVALTPQDNRTVAVESANLLSAEARLRAEQALLEEAQGALSATRRELERREELLQNRLISQEEVESYRQAVVATQARVTSGQAAVEAATADVESVRSRLRGSNIQVDAENSEIQEITAPVNGTVLRVMEESERVILAGTPLFEISNQDILEVVVDLLTQDAVRVDTGDQVSINGWGGDVPVEGVVRYIEPQAFTKISALGVEEQRVNVIIDLLNSPQNLGAGYRVEVAVNILDFDRVLLVPTSALFQDPEGWAVYVVEDDRVALRQISIGDRNRNFARVSYGLSEGEQVVLYPSNLIEEGVKVSY